MFFAKFRHLFHFLEMRCQVVADASRQLRGKFLIK